jgi:hypothetical protein
VVNSSTRRWRRELRARPQGASPPPEEQSLQPEGGSRAPGGLEARLAGVVVAALRKPERDAELDLERQQAEAERDRAEQALRLELQRQAADRDRAAELLAGVAVTHGWAPL